jgi:iron complex outermembrane receptor protein
MSELINKNDNRATIRWKLLTGVSALALTAYVSASAVAKAEDANQPQMWIELGGQLSQLKDKSDFFVPDFPTTRPSVLTPSQEFEKAPTLGFEEEAKISFRPDNSDWILSASIRYGRSLKSAHARQQTHPGNQAYCIYPTIPTPYPCYSAVPRAARFADTTSRNSEQHTILDFQAGKDVGLGLFGKNGSSVLNVGVRFAQFRDRSNIALKSDPDWRFQPKYYYYYTSRKLEFLVQPYHSNAATFQANRSFRGIGPSLSWSGSTPFAGNAQDGELDIDWSANAALLFGRQKTRIEHKTKVLYNNGGLGFLFGHGTLVTATQVTPLPKTRTRNVTVPNVGGSVGLSWRLQDFKVSFGYKADFFFNAIDGGIDARKNENRGFMGPYASISIGLGD